MTEDARHLLFSLVMLAALATAVTGSMVTAIH
jgi:hypothetical protein